MTARLLRWVADKIDSTTREVEVPLTTGPLRSPRNAIVTEDECQERNEAAARLLDPETVGYVIFRVHKDGSYGAIALEAQVDPEAWSSILSAMARVVLDGDRAIR